MANAPAVLAFVLLAVTTAALLQWFASRLGRMGFRRRQRLLMAMPALVFSAAFVELLTRSQPLDEAQPGLASSSPVLPASLRRVLARLCVTISLGPTRPGGSRTLSTPPRASTRTRRISPSSAPAHPSLLLSVAASAS